ncbi:receptor-like protein 14 [Cornus florida]|uniref:receptor-like protein 14 n=1 Tax=Cornus florida TaxID=4283 RepID=UPI00289C80B0|nr:receptor-like protein 14 [Cornus florida]
MGVMGVGSKREPLFCSSKLLSTIQMALPCHHRRVKEQSIAVNGNVLSAMLPHVVSSNFECNATTRRVIKLSLNSTREDGLGDWYLNTSVFLPFESLLSLDLVHNHLLCIKNEGFEKLSRLNNLQILDLSENYFDNNILASLNGLSSLKTLKLRQNYLVGLLYFQGFGKLSMLSNLQILHLSYNNFNNNSILSSLNGFSSLRTLKLQSNDLTRLVYIQDFDGLNSLKELDISSNSLDGIVMREGLERPPSLNSLEVLDLSYNHFNNGIWSFLQGLPSLKTLYIKEYGM